MIYITVREFIELKLIYILKKNAVCSIIWSNNGSPDFDRIKLLERKGS